MKQIFISIMRFLGFYWTIKNYLNSIEQDKEYENWKMAGNPVPPCRRVK